VLFYTGHGLVLGAQTGQRLVIENFTNTTPGIAAGLAVQGDDTAPGLPTDVVVQNVYIHDTRIGVSIRNLSNARFQEVVVRHTGRACWLFGGFGINSLMEKVGLVGVSGLQCATEGLSSADDAFGGNVGKNVWLRDSTAADTGQRGYDFSGHSRGGLPDRTDIHIRNWRSLANGIITGAGEGGVYGSGPLGNVGWYAGACGGNSPTCDANNVFWCDADNDCTIPNGSCRANGWPESCCTGYQTGNGAGRCAAPGGLCYTGFNHGDSTGNGPCAGWALNAGGSLQRAGPHGKFFLGGLSFKDLSNGYREYGSGESELVNTTIFGGAWDGNGNGVLVYDRSARRAHLRNSITMQRTYTPPNAWSGYIGGGAFPVNSAESSRPNSPLSDHNIYGYPSGTGDTFVDFTCPTGALDLCNNTPQTYANIGSAGFTDASDLARSLAQIGFTSVPASPCDRDPRTNGNSARGDYGSCAAGDNAGGSCAVDRDCPGSTCTLHCDFTIQAGSPAIGLGAPLYKAVGAGVNATTVTVGPGAGSGISQTTAAPGDYLLAPGAYLGAVGDTVSIGATTGLTITGITESTCSGCGAGCVNGAFCRYQLDCESGTCGGGQVAFTPQASWNNGDGVTLALTGTAGGFPTAATTTTTSSNTSSSSTSSTTSTSSSTSSSSSSTVPGATTSTSTSSSTSSSTLPGGAGATVPEGRLLAAGSTVGPGTTVLQADGFSACTVEYQNAAGTFQAEVQHATTRTGGWTPVLGSRSGTRGLQVTVDASGYYRGVRLACNACSMGMTYHCASLQRGGR
jgi:hypothetical protein